MSEFSRRRTLDVVLFIFCKRLCNACPVLICIWIVCNDSGAYYHICVRGLILHRRLCGCTASLAKTNFHQNHTQGKLIRVFCRGLVSTCVVQRSPDWLISRPLRWLSGLRCCQLPSLSFHFAGSLDAAISRQAKEFASASRQKTLGLDTHLIGYPEATRGRPV